MCNVFNSFWNITNVSAACGWPCKDQIILLIKLRKAGKCNSVIAVKGGKEGNN